MAGPTTFVWGPWSGSTTWCRSTCVVGCVGGCVTSTRCEPGLMAGSPTNICTKRWDWFTWVRRDTACCGQTHEFFVREPDAGNPHVRFDEREVGTGHGKILWHRQTERAGNTHGFPKLPHHLP